MVIKGGDMHNQARQKIDANIFITQLQDQLCAMKIGTESWRLLDSGTMIERRFDFADFRSGFAFMTHMALFSEHLDHHPSWTQHYKHLVVQLQTHDVDGLSELDLRWAIRAEALYRAEGAFASL